jgi:septal ring factor EnvC (AmiA/AmiB activator)
MRAIWTAAASWAAGASIAGLLVAAILAAAGGPAAAQEGAVDERLKSKDAELQALRREIAEERRKIEEFEKKEKDASSYIRKLENEERLTRRLLRGLEEKEEMLGEKVASLRKDLETNEAVYGERLRILSRRLREIYKSGPESQWQELLQAKDFADLLQRYKFLSLVAEQDAALVTDVRHRKTGIQRSTAELTEKLQEVAASKEEKERELSRLRDNERKRKRSLGELQRDKGKSQKRVEELARAERELEALIEALEKQRVEEPKRTLDYGEKNFPALKGRLIHPVEGPTIRGFGESKHPEFGTVTFNSGVDLDARAGSAVRAVANGLVDYVGAFPNFGTCIVVTHGDGYYTIYAHVSRFLVKKGDVVKAGQTMAEAVGADSGGANAFHFEIRKSKRALDPAEWLRK